MFTAVARVAAFGLALLAPVAARAEECMAASKSADVEAKLASAEAAFGAADASSFQSALEEVALLLPCLADTLPMPTSAHLHRMNGIQAWISGDVPRAREAFLAARVLDPTYHFPETLFGPQHDVRTLYEGLSASDYRDKKAPEPKNGLVVFDGRISRDRPADRTTVMQLLTVSQQVASTNYLRPDQPLPAYASVPRTRNTLWLTAAASLVGAGALYGAAWATRDAFNDTETSYSLDELEGMRTETDVFLVSSGVFAALGVGLGTGGFVVGAR